MIFRAAPSARHCITAFASSVFFNVEQPRKIRFPLNVTELSLENSRLALCLHPPAKKAESWMKTFVEREHGAFWKVIIYLFLHHNGALVFGLTSCSNVSRRKPGRPDCGTCSCPQPVASASWTTHSSLRRRDAWFSPRRSLTARLPVKHPTRAARSKF